MNRHFNTNEKKRLEKLKTLVYEKFNENIISHSDTFMVSVCVNLFINIFCMCKSIYSEKNNLLELKEKKKYNLFIGLTTEEQRNWADNFEKSYLIKKVKELLKNANELLPGKPNIMVYKTHLYLILTTGYNNLTAVPLQKQKHPDTAILSEGIRANIEEQILRLFIGSDIQQVEFDYGAKLEKFCVRIENPKITKETWKKYWKTVENN